MRWMASMVVVSVAACGGGGDEGAGSGGATGQAGSGGAAGSAAGAAGSTGGGSGSAGSTSSGGTGGAAGGTGCGVECSSVTGTFNTTAVSFQCNYPAGPAAGSKTFVNVGGPNLLIICRDAANTYTLTVSLKGPSGKKTGADNQDNYFKLEAGAEGLSSNGANVTDWSLDLTTWDVAGKRAAGTFHVVASDDGSAGLAQWTAFGTLDGKFDVTF